MIRVRTEEAADAAGIRDVQRRAFGREAEAELVDALRGSADGAPRLSLVAEEESREGARLVGHVLLSPVRIEGAERAPAAAGLAPLGVAPEAQRRGIGGALVREALRRAPDLGWRAVFLLGDPGYYTRFGFELAAARGLHYGEGFEAAFQVCLLEPGALRGCAGRVRYPRAFDDL